jgi:vitamin K-dependent gamma-carboxylase
LIVLAVVRERLDRFRDGLPRPVDIASLAAFRVLFGGLLFVAVVRQWAKGGIADAFVAPRFFFPYRGLEWIKPLPGSWMYGVYAAMALLALAFAAGLWFRAAALGLLVLFTYAHLSDAANYLNHYYLVSLLLGLSSFLPLGASASVDVLRRPELRRETIPAWMLTLLRLQIGVVYFFGGIAKLKSDWLVSAMPLRIWLAAAGDFPVLGPILRLRETAYVMSWVGAAFDLSIAFLLCARRTRPFAYACVCVFHLMTARLFQIGMFPWIMMACSLLFFSPSWPRRALAPLGLSRSAPRTSPALEPPLPRLEGARLAAVIAYALMQVVVPLRHWAYPGNVLWTEEAYRFSWNVMLVEKTGSLELHLRDPISGAEQQVRLREELTPFQVKMMATQPDMILAYAHHLADRAEARVGRRPQVFADVVVSLNGRAPTRFVDPSVDLAAERDGLGRRRWVLPAPP